MELLKSILQIYRGVDVIEVDINMTQREFLDKIQNPSLKSKVVHLLESKITPLLSKYMFKQTIKILASPNIYEHDVDICGFECKLNIKRIIEHLLEISLPEDEVLDSNDIETNIKNNIQLIFWRFRKISDVAIWCISICGIYSLENGSSQINNICKSKINDDFLQTLDRGENSIVDTIIDNLILEKINTGNYEILIHDKKLAWKIIENDPIYLTNISQDYTERLGGSSTRNITKYLAEVIQNTIDAYVGDNGGIQIGGFGEGGKLTFLLLLKLFDSNIKIYVEPGNSNASSASFSFTKDEEHYMIKFVNTTKTAFTPKAMDIGATSKSGFDNQSTSKSMIVQKELVYGEKFTAFFS